MDGKLLTISIAAYNVEKCLCHAVESCLVQNDSLLERLEIIIVNDGSGDRTSKIAHKYERLYPGLIRVIDKENGGYGSTVNAAIGEARGKYMRLLDADDCCDTKQLELFISSLAFTDVDLIVTDYMLCYEHKKERVTYSLPTGIITEFKGIDADLSMPSVCFKTKILKDNNILLGEKMLYTDTEFVIYPLYYIRTMYYLPCMIYQYKMGNEGQSVSYRSRISHRQDMEEVNSRLQSYYFQHKPSNGAIGMIERRMAVSERFYLTTLLLSSDRKKAKKILIRYDRMLKKLLPGVYRRMNTRCISFLRKSSYWGYGICASYVRLFQS